MVVKPKKVSKAAPASAGTIRRDEMPTVRAQALTDRIAHQAYRLWEQRGRIDGSALQDWLDAETMVIRQTQESNE